LYCPVIDGRGAEIALPIFLQGKRRFEKSIEQHSGKSCGLYIKRSHYPMQVLYVSTQVQKPPIHAEAPKRKTRVSVGAGFFVSSIPEIGLCMGCKNSIYHAARLFKENNVNNCQLHKKPAHWERVNPIHRIEETTSY
jgi:hypothetical protein